MLSEAETRHIEGYCVWREQQRSSNSDLWARLKQLHEREIQILKTIPYAYHLGHSDAPDCEFWRGQWYRLVLELEAAAPLVKAIVWHLRERGDATISVWLAECEQFKRSHAWEWQSAPWQKDQGNG